MSCVEYHEDFLFGFLDDYGLLESVDAYQAKESANDWKIDNNLCEIIRKITKVGHELVKDPMIKSKDYNNSLRFLTNKNIVLNSVIEIIEAGRARWKIENENNNTLKTKGYHLDHNFDHGKQHLSSTFPTLNIFSFLVHTLLEFFDQRYQLIREELGSRETFFNDIRVLTRYICFDNWHHLLETMMEGLEIPIPSS